jgi:hypothetical protein
VCSRDFPILSLLEGYDALGFFQAPLWRALILWLHASRDFANPPSLQGCSTIPSRTSEDVTHQRQHNSRGSTIHAPVKRQHTGCSTIPPRTSEDVRGFLLSPFAWQ